MHHHVPSTNLLLRTFAAPVELRTPRVLLRQWKDSDAEAWAVMNADPEVRRYFPSVLNRADAQAEADRIRSAIVQRGWGMWALEVPTDRPSHSVMERIGMVQDKDADFDHPAYRSTLRSHGTFCTAYRPSSGARTARAIKITQQGQSGEAASKKSR